mgnify:CR=1 FL=1
MKNELIIATQKNLPGKKAAERKKWSKTGFCRQRRRRAPPPGSRRLPQRPGLRPRLPLHLWPRPRLRAVISLRCLNRRGQAQDRRRQLRPVQHPPIRQLLHLSVAIASEDQPQAVQLLEHHHRKALAYKTGSMKCAECDRHRFPRTGHRPRQSLSGSTHRKTEENRRGAVKHGRPPRKRSESPAESRRIAGDTFTKARHCAGFVVSGQSTPEGNSS